ncbi:MAG: beta-galactosidase, partial [Candidatus Omnitrophica bacterium]|nr:beta-galactosidase [Candidatus Omnitrophota bacterium]
PWDYHEYKRGKLDFTGKTDPARNLVAFLELTRKEKLWVIIRPGPYIYSEWPNEGAPAYAYKFHRLHPKFLSIAKNYMTKVTAVLKPYFATRQNGHIMLFQADNEIDAWPDVFGHQYGLNGQPGLFQEFLKRLYQHNIGKLNDCWGTTYESFDDAGAFIATMLNDEPGLPLKGDRELQRNIDYFKFKYWYAREYAEWMVKTYRDLGVDIPIYLNVYPFFYAHDWVQLQEVSDLVGVDLYPSAELAEDQYEQRKFMDKIRYLKRVSKLPFIAEFASGVWHSRHYETGVLTPNHYRLLALSALMGGISGWNWYMLVNRDNWYMSPINEWGRVHGELYDVFKQVVTIFRRMHPPSLSKITDVAVTFNPLQYAARTLTHNSPVLVALYESDVDYDIYDPRLGVCDKKIIFYSGNQWLEAATQVNLRKYVEKGGILVAFRDYPRKDDRFQPCSLVGFEDPRRILFEFRRKLSIQLAPGRPQVELVSSVYTFDHVQGDKIMVDLGSYGKHAIGYFKKVGKGRILHLGVGPTRELVVEILNYFKIPLVSYSTTPDIKTGLFKRGSSFYLVVTNNGDEDKSASIYLPAIDYRGKMTVRDLMQNTREVRSSERRAPFTTDIRRKDGKVFEFRRI